MKQIAIASGSLLVALLLLMPVSALATFVEEDENNEPSSFQELCTDGLDNDGNDLTDAQDPACSQFFRILTVVKQVVGTSTPASAFSFTINGVDVANLGTFSFEEDGENNYFNTPIGEYSVTETQAEGYTVTYDNCGSGTEGDNALTLTNPGPEEETCTIINTWNVSTTTPTDEGTSTPPTDGGPSTPSGFTNGSGGHKNKSSGSVLGATTCGPLLSSYLKKGSTDTASVLLLQNFLNTELGLTLPVNGIFDDVTEQAVNAFQIKYWENVLAPWVKFGLKSDRTPTGYVYKTTLHKINELYCASLNQPAPLLP